MTQLSNADAGRIIDRIGQSSPKDQGPLRAIGVSRDIASPAILVAFNRSPTDAELRDLHNLLTLAYAGLPAVVREANVFPMRDGLPSLDPRCAWPFPGRESKT